MDLRNALKFEKHGGELPVVIQYENEMVTDVARIGAGDLLDVLTRNRFISCMDGNVTVSNSDVRVLHAYTNCNRDAVLLRTDQYHRDYPGGGGRAAGAYWAAANRHRLREPRSPFIGREPMFNGDGLLPVVVQEESGAVLMLGYMNEAAYQLTKDTRVAWYFSRERQQLWKKGETSGHVQEVRELLATPSGKKILLRVRQKGAVCHDGYETCFYTRIQPDGFFVSLDRVFDPKQVYKK